METKIELNIGQLAKRQIIYIRKKNRLFRNVSCLFSAYSMDCILSHALEAVAI